ncbi:MAG: hypothetical protein EA350_08480 [Gemmatimonadales bacterium]|nr:MAG: hypothetical protein EA350_08480 [Gemmatimonadales bacterium]
MGAMGEVKRRSRWRWAFWGVAGLMVLATLYSAWSERREARDSPLVLAEEVRAQVRAAQSAVDTCLARLAVSETRFRDQARQTEVLEGRIRRLEAMDPRGVPADSYPEYLETVERFNASIEGWETRGGVLEDRQQECRGLVEARNVLADSLRGLLVESGYLPEVPPDPLPDVPPGAPEGDTPPPPGAF